LITLAKQQIIGLREFQKRFNDELSCREHLFSIRWSKGFVCPKCGHTEYYVIKERNTYQCKKCRHQTSVTAGTVMDKTHLKLVIWFWAIYLVAKDKRGCSASQISRELELPYKTAWFLVHRIRKSMTNRDEEYTLNHIVEMDDTYFGTKHKGGKRGRGTSKHKVVVALSKNDNGYPQYLKMQVVPNLKGKTIGKFVENNIELGSTVQSDAYRSYRKPLADKYVHDYKVFDSDSDILHWLHIIIGNAKSFVSGTFHGLGGKHLQVYLDEFCYRFNRRAVQGELFDRLLFATTLASPLHFAELTS
jgi:transposase-like protein